MTGFLSACGGSSGSAPASPGIAGFFTAYPIPEKALDTEPNAITSGPDGALWFTEFAGNKIGRITTAGAMTQFPVPTLAASPEEITSGSDGALWFAERDASKIGRITTAGVITEYPVPGVVSNPTVITAGPDGALWFIGGPASTIGRITTRGVIKTFPLSNPSNELLDITAGPDGALWFTEYPAGTDAGLPNPASAIGRITTSGVITTYPLPIAASSPESIALGSDQALWFTDVSGIGRITTSGAISQYPSNDQLLNITLGPDGAIWATQSGNGASAITRISSTGTQTTYATPASLFDPAGITTGPDGALWFTAYANGGTIGRLH